MSTQTGRMQTLVADLLTLATLEGSPRRPRTAGCSSIPDRPAAADAQALSSGRHPIRFDAATGVELAGWRPSC